MVEVLEGECDGGRLTRVRFASASRVAMVCSITSWREKPSASRCTCGNRPALQAGVSRVVGWREEKPSASRDACEVWPHNEWVGVGVGGATGGLCAGTGPARARSLARKLEGGWREVGGGLEGGWRGVGEGLEGSWSCHAARRLRFVRLGLCEASAQHLHGRDELRHLMQHLTPSRCEQPVLVASVPPAHRAARRRRRRRPCR